MPAPFSRTLRSLAGERTYFGPVSFLGAVLLLGWLAWFLFARVTVYAVSEAARLEVTSEPHPVSAPVEGKVVVSHLALGKRVEAGAVLLVLDSEAARRALDEGKTRLRALTARRQALARENQVERETLIASGIQEGERRTRLARGERLLVEVEGDLVVEQASIRRLEYEVERRIVRAPVAGQLGEVRPVRAGTVVRPGEQLATVVPAGPPRVVAWLPVSALGRVKSGQAARLRLEGFAWTHYGTLRAKVTDTGSEAGAGLFRIELALEPDEWSLIPRQHGLVGSAEVAIEEVSPAVLALRTAGHLLSRRPPSRAGR
jgi:membrane fusion protein (multidrug efflux system)